MAFEVLVYWPVLVCRSRCLSKASGVLGTLRIVFVFLSGATCVFTRGSSTLQLHDVKGIIKNPPTKQVRGSLCLFCSFQPSSFLASLLPAFSLPSANDFVLFKYYFSVVFLVSEGAVIALNLLVVGVCLVIPH